MRAVPGVNITQVSARDINVTTRGATGTLATGQLALLDGRSLYQDFFGFVMWDFLPVNLNEIKQVEVIRGPASAVWGANALNGVVNVITKSPREMQGTSAVLGVGGFDRATGDRPAQGAGTLFYISGTHAQAVNDRRRLQDLGRRLHAGSATRARPAPFRAIAPDVCSGTRASPYPAFTNQGTTQPKFDARVDYDYPDGAKLSFSGGVAGTDGIMHTGIGPFDINSGSVMGYGKVNYANKGFKAAFFTNILNGDADNLLTRDADAATRSCFDFGTKTSTSKRPTSRRSSGKHVVTYGGNLRFNTLRPVAGAAGARTAPKAAATSRTRSSCREHVPPGRRRARRSLRLSRQLRRSRRASTFMVKPMERPDDPRLVQPRLPLAVGDQQLPRRDDRASRSI